MTEIRTEPSSENGPALDEVVWELWKAMELPEGYRAEIIEGAIEVSPTGRFAHARIVNRLRDALAILLKDSEHGAWNDTNVIHTRSAWIPDVLVAPRDAELIETEDGLGIKASTVAMVVEVVSPGHRSQDRDRVRKRREYSRAEIPGYVIIDDYDGQGAVTIFTGTRPDVADWEEIHRVPYGTDVTIPDGPAKGFVIGESITGLKRS